MDPIETHPVSYPESRLQFQPLVAAFEPLKAAARVDFADLIRKKYDVPRPYQRHDEKDQLFLTDSVSDIGDLSPYFADQPPGPRKFYRYFARHHHPPAEYKKHEDYLVMEEEQKDGSTIVAIFEYGKNPYFTTKKGSQAKIQYRKLAACYLVKKGADGSDYQAATLYPPGHPIAVGFVEKTQKQEADDQLLVLKDRQKFLIRDEGKINWSVLSDLESKYQRISPSLAAELLEAAEQNNPLVAQLCENEKLKSLSRKLLGFELTPQMLADFLRVLKDSYPSLLPTAERVAKSQPATSSAGPKETLGLARSLSDSFHQQIAEGRNPVSSSTPADLDDAIRETEASLSGP